MIIDKDRFEKDGFLLVKNVLTSEEVAKIRKVCYQTIESDKKTGAMFYHRFAANHLGDLINIPALKDVILDDRIIEIATTILGSKPTYFGDSVFEIGLGSRGFHKDTSERKDQNHPDWTEEYPIIRIAFYLQDHTKHSGGLKVRVGSHNTVSTNKGKAVFVESEPGDAVVFCLKTSHAGNGIRLKFMPNTSISHILEKRVPNFMKLPELDERVSVFLTFGLKSGALDRYMNFMENHNVYQKRIKYSEYNDELVDEIEQKVDFINMKSNL